MRLESGRPTGNNSGLFNWKNGCLLILPALAKNELLMQLFFSNVINQMMLHILRRVNNVKFVVQT